MLFSFNIFANDNINTIEKNVSGTNKQQLDVRELSQEELIFKNQNLESTDVTISGEKFKNSKEQITIYKKQEFELKEELSEGIKNNYFNTILIGAVAVLGGVLLISSF